MPADLEQRARIAYGERAQHVRDEQGENGDEQSEPESDRERHGGDERGRALEQTCRVARVLSRFLEPAPPPRVARGFGRDGEIPERALRRCARGGGSHSVRDIALDFARAVIAPLL